MTIWIAWPRNWKMKVSSSKAPATVVDQQRARKHELLEKREKLAKLIETLMGK